MLKITLNRIKKMYESHLDQSSSILRLIISEREEEEDRSNGKLTAAGTADRQQMPVGKPRSDREAPTMVTECITEC